MTIWLSRLRWVEGFCNRSIRFSDVFRRHRVSHSSGVLLATPRRRVYCSRWSYSQRSVPIYPTNFVCQHKYFRFQPAQVAIGQKITFIKTIYCSRKIPLFSFSFQSPSIDPLNFLDKEFYTLAGTVQVSVNYFITPIPFPKLQRAEIYSE